jgi:hypothetical protein
MDYFEAIAQSDPWLESSLPSYLRHEELTSLASQIRDDLDPEIAREGSLALNPDDALRINDVLIGLQLYRISLHTIQVSRIHYAIEVICGKATRWPSKLADQADLTMEILTQNHGQFRDFEPILFRHGGRLYGVCDPSDVTKGVSPHLFHQSAYTKHLDS